MVAAVGIERWGRWAERFATLLEKHPVAVSRWVAEVARGRLVDPGIEERTRLDQALSIRALAAQSNGVLSPRKSGK
jgi:hypothetical protein